jgi:DNA-binding CsgD family transcriptional regulator
MCVDGQRPHIPWTPPNSPGAWEDILLHLYGSRLTERERQVTARRVLGASDRQIAAQLTITRAAVRTYDRHICAKLQIESVRQIPHSVYCRLWERFR